MHLVPFLNADSVVVAGNVEWECCSKQKILHGVSFSDNASIHHSGDLEALVAVAGARVVWLPPYRYTAAVRWRHQVLTLVTLDGSPDFNPIEEGFNDYKMWLKRHAPGWGEVLTNEQLTRMALTDVSKNMEAHFRNCYLDVNAMHGRFARRDAQMNAIMGL